MKDPFEREVAVFSTARRLPEAERAAYLDQTCAGDPALRQRVEELLRAGQDAEGFLQEPASGAQRPDGPPVAASLAVGAPAPGEKAGDRIGRYKLLQQIGEGGCGVVYMAEQEEHVRRRVALKVIKLGMDTKQVIARFEAERQALAMMDHPNIAKVLDAGSTETGRPYFVMELVRGIKITEYCDEHNLSTNERLGLFIRVCHAVQHAHQKGVIHRDLKPSNILVASDDGVPVPKVIDFGIAKATQGRLTDQTLFTAFEQFIGTPAYMSPEQAELTMQDVDTRTDIYSLGVLLYELLTGKTPFDAQELLASGLDVMRRTIREQEPERPSTKLSTLLEGELTTTAKHRRTEAAKLVHLLRGDLDWIVMKCLEKDRARRYETANGLANDVRRHLNCEPVVARPPSRLYEFQKTVRRHKFGFVATAAVILALAAGMLGSVWEAGRARRAERAREGEAQRSRQEAARARLAETEANEKSKLARESADEARRQQRLASDQELLARRRFYAAQMNLASQAVESGDLGRALQLLETQRPKAAPQDLRSFEWYHLWGLCNPHLRATLRGHKEPVSSVAISPDGKTLASASHDSTIRLWETTTGKGGLSLKLPPGNPVYAVAFTPDGKTLAAGNWDGLVRLWAVASGQLRTILPGQHGWVKSLAISPDGRYLACGLDDGAIKVFELATQAAQTITAAHQGPVLSVAFSPNGSKLASTSGWGSGGGSSRMWEVTHGQLEPKLQVDSGFLSLAFSPDGNRVAAAGWGDLVVADATGQLQASFKGHLPPILSVAWLPDGKTLLSCAADRTVRLWPIPPTNRVVTENQILGVHLDAVTCLAISTDGTTLASGANDGSVKLWNLAPPPDTAEAQLASQFQFGTSPRDGELTSLSFSPDGNILFGGRDGFLGAKNVDSGQDCPILPKAAGRVVLSPDGKLLAAANKAGTVELWDLARCQLLNRIKAHSSNPDIPVTVAFSPDGRVLATCGFGDHLLKAWGPVPALSLLWQTDIETAGISGVAFSPSGKTIAALIRHRGVASFDALSGRPNSDFKFKCERGYADVLTLAFSPNGKFLATGSDSGTANLWNVELGRLHAALEGHTGRVQAFAFSPDGNTIATGGEDRTVRLWDVATGQERLTLKGFNSEVRAVTFSPDGGTLAAGAVDGLIRLWRVSRLPEAKAYAEHDAEGGQADAENPASLSVTLADPQTARDAVHKFHAASVEYEKLASDPSHLSACWSFAISYEALARQLMEAGQTQQAEQAYRDAQTVWQKLVSAANTEDYRFHLAANYDALGLLLREAGRATESLESYRNAHAIWVKLVAEFNQEDRRNHLGWTRENIGSSLKDAKRYEEASEALQQAIEVWRKLVADFDKEDYRNHLAGTLAILAETLRSQGKVAEAESAEREAADRGDAGIQNNLAWRLATELDPKNRDGTSAVIYAEKAVTATSRTNAVYLDTLAAAYAEAGRFTDGVRVQQEAIAQLSDQNEKLDYRSRLKLYESKQPYRDHGVLAERALALLNAGQFEKAEPVARECLTLREIEIPDDWRTFNARSLLGGTLLGQKKFADAEPLLVSGYQGLKQHEDKIPKDTPRIKEALQRLVQFCEAANRPDQAAEWKQKLAELNKAPK